MDSKELLTKITEEVKEQIKGFATSQDVELAVKAKAEEMTEIKASQVEIQKALDEIKKAAVEQGQAIEKMKQAEPSEPVTIKAQLEAQRDALKAIRKGDKNAVVKTTVLPTAITSNFNGQVIPGIGQLQTRANALRATLNQATLGPNHQEIIRYMDQTLFTNNAAARTIGAAAGESAITWQGYNLSVERYSHFIPVALEMIEDYDFIENEVRSSLLKYLDLAIESAILNGTGTTPAISGIEGASLYTAFSAPAGLANNVPYAGILDTIMAAVAQCQNNTGYQPNFVWMNNFDAMALKLDKDENGMYKFPNFLSQNGMNVDGIRIIGSSLVTADVMYVGDFNYTTLYSGGVEVMMGLNGTDFSERQVSLLANEPVALLQKALNRQSVIKVESIVNAIAALNKGA